MTYYPFNTLYRSDTAVFRALGGFGWFIGVGLLAVAVMSLIFLFGLLVLRRRWHLHRILWFIVTPLALGVIGAISALGRFFYWIDGEPMDHAYGFGLIMSARWLAITAAIIAVWGTIVHLITLRIERSETPANGILKVPKSGGIFFRFLEVDFLPPLIDKRFLSC